MAEQKILNVRLEEGDRGVVLLDQSQLPNRVEYRTVTRLPDMVEAIQSLRAPPPSASSPGTACTCWPGSSWSRGCPALPFWMSWTDREKCLSAPGPQR